MMIKKSQGVKVMAHFLIKYSTLNRRTKRSIFIHTTQDIAGLDWKSSEKEKKSEKEKRIESLSPVSKSDFIIRSLHGLEIDKW